MATRGKVMDLFKEVFWTLWVLIYLHIMPKKQAIRPKISMVWSFSSTLNIITNELLADSQNLAQTSPLYQQPSQQIKVPQRGRSNTLPGAKNPQPKVFEGHLKASWNRKLECASGGVAPSSQHDPYAGVWKWNELNSQGFFEENTNDPPPSRIQPIEVKSIPLGPRYTRTRKRQELHQQTHPSDSKHLPNPENLLSGNHTHRPRAAEKTTSRGGSPGRDANDEYVGFIIPSDPYTLHSVQEDIRRFQNLGTGRTKVDVTEHNGVAGKGQITVLTCQQPAPKVDSSNSKTGFFPGAAENPTSKNGGCGSGVNDEYMGFIIPSEPYTFYPVQKSDARLQNLGTNYKKTRIIKADGKATAARIAELILSQPAPEVNYSNSKTASWQADTKKNWAPPFAMEKIV